LPSSLRRASAAAQRVIDHRGKVVLITRPRRVAHLMEKQERLHLGGRDPLPQLVTEPFGNILHIQAGIEVNFVGSGLLSFPVAFRRRGIGELGPAPRFVSPVSLKAYIADPIVPGVPEHYVRV
jgi:hypothetical protein